jgi:16S rRNA G966 N2-methylase RsmD
MASKPKLANNTPFYIEVTNVKEGDVDIPLITLPPGTVLFRSIRLPNRDLGEDARFFYRDYLGTPEDRTYKGRVIEKLVCLPPTHNVFFYPFPFIGFGIHDYGKSIHSMQAVVLVHPMTVVSNVSPSKMSRGDTHAKVAGDIYARCNEFSFDCRPQTSYEIEAKTYDNCLNPYYQQRSGTRGWMAIANLDSLFPKRQDKLRSVSPMAQYINNLEQHFPGQGAEVLAWAYTDERKHQGFPEIALYPYFNHPGPDTIVRRCKDNDDAIQIMVDEASRNNLNYLPLATFVKEGIVDMVAGQYDLGCVPADSNTFAANTTAYQPNMEGHIRAWMNHAETEGIDLPFYGKQRLQFDTRTGFFVLPQMLPSKFQIPVPKDPRRPADPSMIPYRNLLLPLRTEEDRQRALEYMILFREFLPDKAFQIFGLQKGFGVRRAMVLNRPPVLKILFENMRMKMPALYEKMAKRAAYQYKQNTGKESKANVERKKAEQGYLDFMLQIKNFNIKAKQVNTNAPLAIFQPNTFEALQANAEVSLSSTLDEVLKMSDAEYESIFTKSGRTEEIVEDKKSKRYIFTSPEDVKKAPQEVQVKLEYYFKNLPEDQRWKIQMDDVALFSVTEPTLAEQQSLLIRRALYDVVGAEGLKQAVITDATACVGGNTISFADYFFVNTVELSPQRARMLTNNVMVYNKQKKTRVICADYTVAMKTLTQDVVFFDPPWGGRDYKKTSSIDMFLGPHNVADLAVQLLTEDKTKLVAIKAPVNYNVKGLREKVEATGTIILRDAIEMPKMLLLILQKRFAPKSPEFAPKSPNFYPNMNTTAQPTTLLLTKPPVNNENKSQNSASTVRSNASSIRGFGGGFKKTRHVRLGKSRQTRKAKGRGVGYGFAHIFHRVWKAHVKANSNL